MGADGAKQNAPNKDDIPRQKIFPKTISPNDPYRGRSNQHYKRLGSPREWLPQTKIERSQK
jgi:hypothetical protein